MLRRGALWDPFQSGNNMSGQLRFLYYPVEAVRVHIQAIEPRLCSVLGTGLWSRNSSGPGQEWGEEQDLAV